MRPKEETSNNCANCAFSIRHRDPNNIGADNYECHSIPPTVHVNLVPGPGGQVGQMISSPFPIVAADCFCGDWEEGDEPEKEVAPDTAPKLATVTQHRRRDREGKPAA